MTYLLDTGVWVRAVNQPHTIPADVLRILQAPREGFGLAAISLWEVGKKTQIGKLPLPRDLPLWFADALASNIELFPSPSPSSSKPCACPRFPIAIQPTRSLSQPRASMTSRS